MNHYLSIGCQLVHNISRHFRAMLPDQVHFLPVKMKCDYLKLFGQFGAFVFAHQPPPFVCQFGLVLARKDLLLLQLVLQMAHINDISKVERYETDA